MNKPIDSLTIQFGLLHDCVRGCIYANYITLKQEKADAWWSIGDMCYSDAIISWNAIFGVNSQESHWKTFTKNNPIPSTSQLKPFNIETLTQHLEISITEWATYWRQMTEMRNKRIAHIDHKSTFKSYPNITLALHSACFYRFWLGQLVKEKQKNGENIKFEGESTDEMIKLFNSQIREICK